MVRLRYHVVDVFTDRPLAGNPLAVVLDADRLSTRRMQAVAREFHLSETAFLLAPDVRGADYRLRIFTPDQELPFAGHPSVGTAWLLARLGRIRPGRVVQSCGAGRLPLQVAADGGPVTLAGGRLTVSRQLEPAPLLAAVGLRASDLVGPPPRRAGAGLEFEYLCVHDPAVRRSGPQLDRFAGVTGTGVFVFSLDGLDVHARMFTGSPNLPEDPATGSAALGLGGWLVAEGVAVADGETGYTVRQGAEMHRPSRLECTVTARRGRATGAQVSGDVVHVAEGMLLV
jgi:trans-2,3-dihydro-3-hydroxyanthranilate isomerase